MRHLPPRQSRCNSDPGDASTLPLLPHRYDERAPIERLVTHLHDLRPRALAEFLSALSEEHGIGLEIIAKLEEFCRLNLAMLRATGGDQFAPKPLRSIGGGR